MPHCETQAKLAGFASLELAATLPGVPLHLAAGFEVVEIYTSTLPGDIDLALGALAQAQAHRATAP